jgi:hypothetical protein
MPSSPSLNLELSLPYRFQGSRMNTDKLSALFGLRCGLDHAIPVALATLAQNAIRSGVALVEAHGVISTKYRKLVLSPCRTAIAALANDARVESLARTVGPPRAHDVSALRVMLTLSNPSDWYALAKRCATVSGASAVRRTVHQQ